MLPESNRPNASDGGTPDKQEIPDQTRTLNTVVNHWMGEAVVLGFITAAGVWVAFSYEEGFCSHFRIPSQLISLETAVLVQALATVFTTILILVVVVNPFTASFPANTPFKRRVWSVYGPGAVLSLALVFVGSPWKLSLVAVLTFAASAAIDIAYSLFFHKDRPTLAEKWNAQQDNEEERRGGMMFSVLLSRIDSRLFLSAWAVFLLTLVAYGKGKGDAAKQEWYLVNGKNAVLRIYGDRMILRPLTTEEHKVDNALSILMIDVPGHSFSWKRIGPLEPIETE